MLNPARPETCQSGRIWPKAPAPFLDRITRTGIQPGPSGVAEPPPADAPAPGGGQFLSKSYSNQAGTRAYKLYVPSQYRGQPLPLIVMLHGCTQSPEDFAAGTRMNLRAEEHNCFVAYPAQPASANPSKCWNWFRPGDQARGRGEPALIAGITREVMREYSIDEDRVYAAGLSAGAAAAAILAAAYPDLYAAIGVHSGLACGVANDVASAFAAMRQSSPAARRRAAGNSSAKTGYSRIVPAIVFHGDRDATVHPRNGDQVIAQLGETISGLATATERGQAPGGRAYSRTLHRDPSGKAVFEQWVVHGAGHAWSGGSPAGSYTDPLRAGRHRRDAPLLSRTPAEFLNCRSTGKAQISLARSAYRRKSPSGYIVSHSYDQRRDRSMHDIVIRGGTIIDGTGRPAFAGDVAVDGGRIAAVGGKAGPARREIAADGLLVTPGWVDVHTHYDGQATWDPVLAPSSWHGVTTILFGNCGVGFAPVRPHHRDALIDLMEGVEDIPGPVLAEGLKWDWQSFPDFLDALERMPRAIDVAAQVPHHPLRVYVMGDRAIRREPATAEDIAEMRRLTEEAVRAGAFGFTTSRTNAHKTTQGEMVPGRFAEIDELTGIGAGPRRGGRRHLRHEQRFRGRASPSLPGSPGSARKPAARSGFC